jgi:hypothetical protein
MAPWREAAVKQGYASSIAFPLMLDGGQCLGALTLYAEADAFDEAEVELLGEAAGDLAFGISRLRDQTRRREAERCRCRQTGFRRFFAPPDFAAAYRWRCQPDTSSHSAAMSAFLPPLARRCSPFSSERRF